MKVVELQNSFGMGHLVVAEKPSPEPGPGEILLQMKAISLNYRDLLTVRGHYNPHQPLPLIICSDGVGEVIAVGEGVDRVKKGDRVAATFFQDWIAGAPAAWKLKTTLGGPLSGTLCERMVLKQDGVVHIPGHLSPEEAATLPCAALTAWNALSTHVKAGDRVLIQGTGGVALFALQFAKMMGAEVIITSSSDDKLAQAKEFGADHCVNYKKTPAWGKEVKAVAGDGVDLAIELGGAGTLPETFQSCRPGATIALIGVLSGVVANLDIVPILMKSLRIQGILVGNREQFEQMNRAIAQHRLRPVIDKTFPFDQSVKALEHLAGGTHFGKICISL